MSTPHEGTNSLKNGTNGKYPAETAGRSMVPAENIPIATLDMRVGAIREMIERESRRFETINYIYVAGPGRRLFGVISIKELLSADKEKEAQDIMQASMVSVHPYTDQQRIALLALEKNVKAIPVIDKEGEFLGAVQFHAILKILDTESVEDMFRLGGLYHHSTMDNVLTMPIRRSLKHRIPWLVIGLFGGMAAAAIVGAFEETIASNIVLAAFIPLMIYMSDAVGTQMETFIIRDLAVDPKLKFLRYMARQTYVVFLIGVILSIALLLVSYIFYNDAIVSLVLALALFLAICSSVTTGLLIPFLFDKMKLDPANASGPIATIVQEVISILIYFTIAAWLL